MASMLHITNGDNAADLIRQSGIKGDVLPWRDPMHHGPFPAGIELGELSRLRIQYLSGGMEGADETTSHGFSHRDATLARASEFDEVILWFEHDVLDQLQILQLLHYFNKTKSKEPNLSMICIDHFDGVPGFRGLGQLAPAQIASLFPSRNKLTPLQLQQASRCWDSFLEPEPLALQQLIATDISELPFMRSALIRQCQDFPWLSDGLTRTERQLLKLVQEGETKAAQLFVRNMDFETCLYIGDARTYSVIESLCNGDKPLLSSSDGQPFKHPYHTDITAEQFKAQRLAISEFGRQVLAGKIASSEVLDRDGWLGGVHLLAGRSVWYWDENGQVFQHGI